MHIFQSPRDSEKKQLDPDKVNKVTEEKEKTGNKGTPKLDRGVKRKRKGEDSKSPTKLQKTDHVIASLFKHNPEIPQLDR